MKNIKTYKTGFKKIRFFILSLLSLIFLNSCESFVSIEPPKTEIITEEVFENDATAESAIRGIYSQLISVAGFLDGSNFSITFRAGLSADEFLSFSPANNEFFFNTLEAENNQVSTYWNHPFNYIYATNAMIEGLANSPNITSSLKAQLEGEAKFIRALCHFYLVNLYGDIPIITTTDFEVNRLKSRAPINEVYDQIISDLQGAQSLLSADYVTSERIRPNKATATALLARTYLYTGQWTDAEQQATSIISNTSLYDTVPLNEVFLANSKETIWQLKPTRDDINTNEGLNFILVQTPSGLSVSLSDELLSAFEDGDERKINWVGSYFNGTTTFYYPFKYKIRAGSPGIEYSMVFRLGEQYLIRAEARAQQGDIDGAKADLNIIRKRAGLPDTEANVQASLLLAIEQERRIELFAEKGHRWFDLKRTGRADAVLSAIPLKDWQSTDALYPIPKTELANGINLTQNPGYN